MVKLSPEIFEEYEDYLIEIIQEIYDVSLKFEHNAKAQYCMLCNA